MAVTGANIPPELFDDILWHVTDSWLTEKRELSGCSLVCRYWAKISRPPIFKSIRLSKLETVAKGMSITQAPLIPGLPSPASYVESVEVNNLCPSKIDGRPPPPWLHHICRLIPRFPNCTKVQLLVEGTDLILGSALPRTLPLSTVFSPFTEFIISGPVRFKRYSQLRNICRAMRYQQKITWIKITWEVDDSTRDDYRVWLGSPPPIRCATEFRMSIYPLQEPSRRADLQLINASSICAVIELWVNRKQSIEHTRQRLWICSGDKSQFTLSSSDMHT